MDLNHSVISVIIPVYNVEAYIQECLESIVNQTYRHLEIILVDDGSMDNSGKLCDQYAKKDMRIKVFHTENKGVSSARNIGLDVATGEYVAFIDSDDWIELDTFEIAFTKLVETDTDLCFFDSEFVYVNGKKVVKNTILDNAEVFKNLDQLKTLCDYMNWTGICNFLVKSTLVKNLRFYEEIWTGEDTIFKLLLYKKLTAFSYLRKVLYHYRLLGNSCTGCIRKDLPQIVYKRYNIMSEIIATGNYPRNAQIIPNTIDLMRELRFVVDIAFERNLSLKCDYKIIKDYIETAEFKYAVHNYNKHMLGKISSLYLFWGYPNMIWITIVYIIQSLASKMIGNIRI